MEGDPDLAGQVRAAVGRVHRRFRAERPDDGLGNAGVTALAAIVRDGPLTLTGLSAYERVKPPTMSEIVDRLARRDYVRRERDPADGRRVLLVATPAGEAAVAAIRAEGSRWLEAAIAELDAEEQAVLREAAGLLRRIADA